MLQFYSKSRVQLSQTIDNISWQVPLLAFGLAAVLGWDAEGFDEHGWSSEVHGDEHGGWEVEQAAAGSQMGGWEVLQQPQYQDLQQQRNPYQQYDQQQYDQQKLYGQEKDQQYYAQFRAQIDQIQRGGGRFQERPIQRYDGRFQERQIQRGNAGRLPERYLEPSYQHGGLQGGGVERDHHQRLFGSAREFGESADPLLKFGKDLGESDPLFPFNKEFGESDPLFKFGGNSVKLGQPVAWDEARKRLEIE